MFNLFTNPDRRKAALPSYQDAAAKPQGLLGNSNPTMGLLGNPLFAIGSALLNPRQSFGQNLQQGFQNLMQQQMYKAEQDRKNRLDQIQLLTLQNQFRTKREGSPYKIMTKNGPVLMQPMSDGSTQNLGTPVISKSSLEKDFNFMRGLKENEGLSDEQILNKALSRGGTNLTVDMMAKNQPKYSDQINFEYDKNFIKEITPKFRSLNQSQIRLNKISNILEKDDLFVGAFAEPRQALARLGNYLGFVGNDALNNTAELIQGLAKGQLDASATLQGQGVISDSERLIIKKAADGDLSFTKGELQTLNNALKKIVSYEISTIQSDVSNITQRLDGMNQPVIDAITNPTTKSILQKQLETQKNFLINIFKIKPNQLSNDNKNSGNRIPTREDLIKERNKRNR
jgi:hypothetical protein